jgi:hypothetical protein
MFTQNRFLNKINFSGKRQINDVMVLLCIIRFILTRINYLSNEILDKPNLLLSGVRAKDLRGRGNFQDLRGDSTYLGKQSLQCLSSSQKFLKRSFFLNYLASSIRNWALVLGLVNSLLILLNNSLIFKIKSQRKTFFQWHRIGDVTVSELVRKEPRKNLT